MLTANGTEYLKPSRRAARAKAAGAQLLLSIHLNYDADSRVSGFECCPATPQLSTNADSLRFARLVAEKFSAMGMELRGIDGVRYIYFDDNDNRYIRESNDTTVLSDPTFPWCRNAAARRCWWRRASSQTPAMLPWSPPTQPARRRHRRTMNVS